MKFDTLKDNFTIPSAEQKILEFWEKEDIFHKTQQMAKDRPHFVFYEGPPTANGSPGIHHVIARTIKDLVCRYKYMRGFRVDRKAGWDTHGLPVEIAVEKELKLDSKAKVIEYGIARFNKKCRESVFTHLEDWNKLTSRIGYWLDLDDAYVTLTNEYIESVWWILKNLFDKGLIYKGFKTVPFCPRCGTGLSSHEVAQGYAEVRDPSVFVKVKAADDDFSYLVWTTTPWTLPSNAALCMKPDADYVLVEHEGEKLVLAEALVEQVLGEPKEAIKRFKGKDFLKRKYEPMFDTFKNQADQAFFVINADFVTLEDGTGIVHIAPGFGADDYVVGQKFGLPVFQAIEPNGIFKDFAGPYAGMFIKDADPVIIKDLKIAGKLFKKEIYTHNYPFCWRCESPLIYIARQSWYIKTTQYKERLVANMNAINWYPDEIRTGRMLDWLENNVDWALSRERFWGTPLPIWICDNPECGKQTAIGSIEELKERAHETSAQEVTGSLDLHKPQMDDIKLACRHCGSTMTRVPEVIDCWFDSGSMPYAQWHYPFENEEEFKIKYPAEFISEAIDQTRGWFYSLLAISTMLFDKPPFKNVIVIGHIQDKEGKKMSKSKGNVVNPFEVVDKYGADPLRWYLMCISNPWLPTRFDEAILGEVVRKYFDTLRNTYSFFTLYANIDGILEKSNAAGQTVDAYLESKACEPERFDRWIISRYNSLIKDVTALLDKYDITRPARAIQMFVIDELSNWYVRNNRRRFWAKGDDPSKMRAYLTLYRVLEGVCRLTAPITPFISELIWRELMGKHGKQSTDMALSVHATEYPKYDESLIDTDLEEAMGLVEKIVSLGRAARARKNIKVRQPLSRLMIGLPQQVSYDKLVDYLDIVRDELNIKEIEAADNIDNFVTYTAKLRFKEAGPRLGADVKAAAGYISSLDSESIKKFIREKELAFDVNGHSVNLTDDLVEVIRNERDGYAVESDGTLTIALDTELTDDLINEGFAREIVNKVQNMRKTSGFEVTDHIKIHVSSSERLQAAAQKYEEFICRETLAISINFTNGSTLDGGAEWNINGEKALIAVAKM